MNIQQIKGQIAREMKFADPNFTLLLRVDKTEKDEPTEWVSYWDDATRTRVSMHNDVHKKLAADKEINTLAVKKELVPATDVRAAYMRYVVITPQDIAGAY